MGYCLFFDLTPGTACLQTTDVILYIVCVRSPYSNTVHVEPDKGSLSPGPRASYPRAPCPTASRSPSPVLRLLLLLQKDYGGRKEEGEKQTKEEEEEGEDQEGAGGQAVIQADINSIT